MHSKYATDEMISTLMGSGRKLTSAQYIYNEEEANEQFSAVVQEANWILNVLPEMLSVRGNVRYAAASSLAPFQVSFMGGDDFIVLIDPRAFYYLLTLCLRLQTLPPLTTATESVAIPEERDYHGRYLLDITKDIVFHTPRVEHLIAANPSRIVYQAALIYIVAHELAHVSHGHIEFMSCSEFAPYATSDEEENLTFRTLEMDADSSATSNVYAVFEKINGAFPSNIDQNKKGREAKEMLRRSYILGIYIAHIFQDTLATTYAPKKHPIGYARFLTSAGVLKKLFEKEIPQAAAVPEEMRQILVSTFVKLSGDLAYLGHPIASNVIVADGGVIAPAYDLIGEMAGRVHLEPLFGRWSRIRPLLERFQRGGVLAPATASPL